MDYTENIKNRMPVVATAIAAYVFLPVIIGLSLFPIFNPVSFPLMGIVVHSIQVFGGVILLYGALEWVKPSLIPKSIPKRIIGIVILAIVVLAILSEGALNLEESGSCTIVNHSQDGKVVTSSNGKSTEQNCIDSCIEEGNRNIKFNQVSCEFSGIGGSWSKTPEEFQGYKPKI